MKSLLKPLHKIYQEVLLILTLLVFTSLCLIPSVAAQQQMSTDDILSTLKNTVHYQNCEGGAAGAPQGTAAATGKVYMIGDSITQGAKTQLDAAFKAKGFTTTEINGVASRLLSEGTRDIDGLTVLGNDRPKYADASTIVIALGTNGGVTDVNIGKAIDLAKAGSPTAKIYWVNVGVDNSKRTGGPINAESINQMIAGNTSRGYTVIDWAAQVAAHSEYINGDGLGVHLESAGNDAFANTVATGASGGTAFLKYQSPIASAKPKGLLARVKNFFSGKASAQTPPASNPTVPIPTPPPVVDNNGLKNAEIPADRLTDMNTIPNVQVTGSNLIRKEIVPNLTQLAQAFKDKFGRNLHIFSGYRDLAQQQQSLDAALAKGNTNTVAPLGQSSHGWGLAIDIEQAKLDTGNTENDFNSEEYKWLATEGVKLGWKNPYYKGHGGQAAEEPWHWEYGTTNSWGAGSNGQQAAFQPKTDACSCSVTAATLPGSNVKEQVWNYFLSKQFGPKVIAGIMGNIQAESGFNPAIVEGGNGIGFGLVQWSFGRRTALEQAAAEKGVPPSDLNFQLDFLWKELEGPYKSNTLDPLKAINETDSDALERASNIFLENFERPADIPGNRPKRKAFAEAILAELGSLSGGGYSSASATCASGQTNGVTGGFSLPLEQKWYDQHKEWFTKPHHDYPAADIPVPTGTPVFSMTAGRIIKAPNEGGYGIGVTIDAGNGIIITYGHGSDGGSVENAKEGDTVQPGQLIMHSASTGQSTGPHLHLEIDVDGDTEVCPQTLFVGIVEGNIPDVKTLPKSGCTN